MRENGQTDSEDEGREIEEMLDEIEMEAYRIEAARRGERNDEEDMERLRQGDRSWQ